MSQDPSPGRMVRFVPPQACTAESTLAFYPAIITQVNADGSCELCTFGPNSIYFQHGIHQSEGAEQGKYHFFFDFKKKVAEIVDARS